MARVLILRAADAAERTAEALRADGHQPLAIPVSEIAPLSPAVPDVSAYAAVLVSSVNAVPFAAQALPRDIAVLGVGPATAQALRDAGFGTVTAARSCGQDLAVQAAAFAQGGAGGLLYLAGRVRTDALEGELAARGIAVEILEVYDTRPLHPTREAVEAALGRRSPDAVLVLSAGQAEGLARIVQVAPDLFMPPLRILCLSPRIRERLPDTIEATVFVSEDSELSNLLALL